MLEIYKQALSTMGYLLLRVTSLHVADKRNKGMDDNILVTHPLVENILEELSSFLASLKFAPREVSNAFFDSLTRELAEGNYLEQEGVLYRTTLCNIVSELTAGNELMLQKFSEACHKAFVALQSKKAS